MYVFNSCENTFSVFQKDYLDQQKLRLWDFFRNIDKDGTMRVPVADFRKAVQVFFHINVDLLSWELSDLCSISTAPMDFSDRIR